MDAVARYRRASEQNDLAALMAALAPDARTRFAAVRHMIFCGHEGLRVLLDAVYGSLTNLRWQEEVGDRLMRAVTGECRVAGLRLGDAMVLELGEDDKIVRIRPHLRPGLATSGFASLIGARLLSHPGVLQGLRDARTAPPPGVRLEAAGSAGAPLRR